MAKTLDIPEGFEIETPSKSNKKNDEVVTAPLRGKVENVWDADVSQLNEDYKQRYQNLINERKLWEARHPFISDLQKDLQPGYRAKLTDWETKARYGLIPPIGAKLSSDIKQLEQNFIPATGIATAIATDGASLTGNIAGRLTPFLGRKIAHSTASGLVGGGAGTGIAEIGRMIFDNENSMNALKNTAIGLVGGGALGLVGGRVGRYFAGKNLKKIKSLDGLSQDEIKNIRNMAKTYYNDYIKGTTVSRKDLGKINFGNAGIDELTSKGLHNVNTLPDLKKQIKTGKKQPNPRYDYEREDIDRFHIIENDLNGKNYEYQIAEDNNGNKYYFTKDVTNNKELSPTDWNQHPASEITPKNIITDGAEKFNPPEYFGGDVGGEISTTPEMKQSKLPQTMRKNRTLPPELENVTPEYQVLHNKDLAEQATQALNDNKAGVENSLRNLLNNEKSELSALDFEQARQLVKDYYNQAKIFKAQGNETGAQTAIDRALILTDQISKKASKSGQAVQALSLWSKTTPEGAVRQAQNIISDFNKTAKKKIPDLTPEQAQEITNLAENVQKTEMGTRDNAVATQLLMKYLKELVPVSAGQKIRTIQNISLLLNPKTFERNIAGNSIFAGIENLFTKPLAAGLDKLASLKTGQRTRVLPQLREYTQGLGQGFREGVDDVSKGINTRNLGARFNLDDRPSFAGTPVLDQLEKALNYSLQVPDRMFYQATYNESLANQLAAQGLKEPTAKMVQQAEQEALEAVFQNNSRLGDAILNARRAGNDILNINGYGLGDAFIPYAQTPANIAVQGWNHSPLGAINAVKNGLAGNQRQATLDLARALTGTGLGVGGFEMAKNGIINPAIDNYKERKNYEAMGIRPNTLNIGDYNVSFNQLQPLAAPILAGVATNDIKNGDFNAITDKVADSLLDLGMLQSVSQFMSDYQNHGLGTATTNMVGSIPSRFVPTGLKQINDLIDPIQRETYDSNPIKYGLNQAQAKIPRLSKLLPAKYDVTGQPIQKYQTQGVGRVLDSTVNPVFINKKLDDATLNTLIDLAEKTGDNSVLLPVAPNNIKFKDLQGNQVNRKLSGVQRSQYQQQIGTLNKQILDDIVNTDFFNSLEDEEKINLINTVQRYNKNYVDEKLFNKPNSVKRNLIKKLTATERDKIMREVLKMYKDDVLPVKVNQVYEQNF